MLRSVNRLLLGLAIGAPLVTLLVGCGSDPDATINREDADKLTPLMRACARGDLTAARGLLSKGADPNLASSEQGVTALMFASYWGHSDLVNLLVEKGAHIDARDTGGNGAIDWAAVGGQKAIAVQFATRGARLNPPKSGGALGAMLAVGGMPLWLMDKAKLRPSTVPTR